jgi:hypothetical protein
VTSSAEAYVDGAGDLVVEVQDLGEEMERLFGDFDYEWWVVVRASNKPKLLERLWKLRQDISPTVASSDQDAALLSLIERTFGGRPSAPSDLEDWLKENGIAYEVSTYA